jgi:hypothetical protein
VTLSVLLALAGTVLVGYRFGDSNHGITVPILKRLMNPEMYPGDVMVATAEKFPTVFYRGLAAVLYDADWIPFAFFVLYVLSIAATLAGAYRLGRWAGGPAAGVLALLFAFPVRIGLAGEALYRVAFSHSHVASALAIWAIVWFVEGRRVLPLLVLSLGAYNHLLYSAYVLVPMVLYLLWEWWESEDPRRTRRLLVLLAAAVVPLIPLAVWTLAQSTPMTPEWLELLRLRSSHHSFPSAFLGDLPDAAALLALAALAAGHLPLDRRRLLMVFLLGTALQFVLGSLFTEVFPAKAVLQYQAHRSWRFLMLILQAVVAAGVAVSFRERGLSRAVAIATGIVVFVPGFEALLPVAVVLQATLGRPAPSAWSRFTAAALLVLITGWGDRPPTLDFLTDLLPRLTTSTVLAAAAVVVVHRVAREQARFVRLWRLAVFGLTFFGLGWSAYARARDRWESGMWRDAQNWVRQHTPAHAVFLTPPRGENGFRVFSERTIVGEWKDGTQQYFDDAFVKEWGARMEALEGYDRLSDEELLAVAGRFGATHIVTAARPPRKLMLIYKNRQWAVYRALMTFE